ncbi:MAG: efflux RND transporter periplasmic adaptor subunit [Anaerolineaceae bacterium]|nr:efflux RND transporter periplasmic adaptor subunit [Anaerolineaceae bacterium]
MMTNDDRKKRRQSRKKNRTIIILSLVAVLVVGGLWYFIASSGSEPVQAEATLQTTTARLGDIVIRANGIGELQPAEAVSVGFQVNGLLTELDIEVGDVVEEGQVIAKLDDTNARAQLAQANLNWQAIASPTAIADAELALFKAQDAVAAAKEDLMFQISPAVYYWETELANAQANLTALEADSNSTPVAVSEAQALVTRYQANLSQAQYVYKSEYIYAAFSYTYTDQLTGELAVDGTTGEYLTTVIPPSSSDIELARTTLRAAEIKLDEAAVYLAVLRDEPQPETKYSVTSGAKLAQLEQTRLALENAELTLVHQTLLAPISGTIIEVNSAVGQSVSTNPIISIASLDNLIFQFYLAESDLQYAQPGKPLNVTFEAFPYRIVSGVISKVDVSLSMLDGDPVIKAWGVLEIPSDMNLLIGMTGEVEVIAGETYDAIVVPVQALRELAADTYSVFVVDDNGELEMRIVTVGLMDFANAEILTGLDRGDIVSTGTIETGN